MKFVALAAIAAALAAPSALASTPKLVATDGPGYTISLKTGGKSVSRLKAGTYVITVKDLANAHNFHLAGPGVDKRTSVSAKGTYTWKVTLKKGTYKYVCDPHASFMKGSFKVS